MEDQLLQAYYWLSSAIAQAFAALIALTGMFYIYRRQELNNRLKETANSLAIVLDLIEVEFGTIERLISRNEILNNVMTNQHGLRQSDIVRWSLFSPNELIEHANRKLQVIPRLTERDWEFGRCRRLRDLLRNIEYRVAKYNQILDDINRHRLLTKGSIILSALAMAAGIAALLFGHKLCLSQKWIVMISESILAAVALGWTAYVVIRMLKEPKEPKPEARQE